MSTEEIFRLLSERGDLEATLALKKRAMRHNDGLLLDYVEAVTEQRINQLEQELQRWRKCLEFGPSLILLSFGEKIQAIKLVRSLTGLGLSGSKQLVDKTPTVIGTVLDPQKAQDAISLFEKVGARAVWGDVEQIETEEGLDIHKTNAVPRLASP